MPNLTHCFGVVTIRSQYDDTHHAAQRAHVTYVPGHELILIFDRYSAVGRVWSVKCGSVINDSKSASASPVRNEPPAYGAVGKAISFTPDFKKPAGASSVTFRLAKGPDDISVNAKTGRMDWTPSDAYIGRYDIDIAVIIDGAESSLLTWTITIVP